MALTDEEMEKLKNGDSAAHDNGGGADLAYKDDHEESYPDIFENAETADDEETRARVIRVLKALSEKKDLDKYLDTEEIIRYFAVHNYLMAYDSYTGPMLHNYCLYENNGKLASLIGVSVALLIIRREPQSWFSLPEKAPPPVPLRGRRALKSR